ncbi:acyltransferase family protein [Nocardia sp. SYP-A9097]|uniref:acyltransferase family protein n=1 Tax=Nocardia sp. SYP-A9097 TaxID=2663237 RepID=UPI00129B319D|nr:acyltransferase family protein [Nocardia sp. SYP-A9097]MRH90984.1 acyltransferase family protein [Nocardia sp. SYP-A9097]
MSLPSTDQPSPTAPDSDPKAAPVPSPGSGAAGRAPGAYRHDLDGLRGIAIALVVIFHVWFGRVSGGVDVFLVLSGFFFTGMLVRRSDGGPVGVAATIRRTLRRLLPAMVVVLAAVVIAAVVLLPHTRWSDIAAQTLASLFYYQNWYLALSWSDYLAADPSVSPLQHLWSMSVQGQCYLGLLMLIATTAWLYRRGRPMALRVAPVRRVLHSDSIRGVTHSPVTRRVLRAAGPQGGLRIALAVLFAVLAVVSFRYAAVGVSTQQGWNYYDTFARAWEPLTGALLAIVAPMLNLPKLIRTVFAWAGIAAIVACGWLVNGSAVFPGPAALIPVTATAALILAGAGLATAGQPSVNRLLAGAPMVGLGGFAYALYLWHWPMLIFYLGERHERAAGALGGLLIIVASFVLAYGTHRFVEEPLRLRATPALPARARMLTGVAVSTVGVLLLGSTLAWQWSNGAKAHAVGELDPAKYPGAAALTDRALVPRAPMRPTIEEAPADIAYPTRDSCIADFDTRSVVTCAYGDPNAHRTIAVVGNSHAEHWIPALQAVAEKYRFKVSVYLKMGCPLTVAEEPMYKGQNNPDCKDWSHDVIERLGAERPDFVFTTGTRPADNGGDETPQDYLDVWQALSDRGLQVLAIRDTPWLRRNGIRYRAIDCLASGGNRLECGMKRSDALSPVDPALAASDDFPNVHVLDLNNAVCEPDVCAVVEGNILVYHDEHHLTASYSRSLAPELARRLQPILGWW